MEEKIKSYIKRIEINDRTEKIIKKWYIKKPHPKLWKWQFKIENAT